MLRRASLVAVAAFAAWPTAARANGRYPQTASVSFEPGNNHRIIVGATFGMLLSEDDGATWRWTCETNVGYSGNFDPIYAMSSQGTIFASTFNGLAISRDNGCDFDFAGAPLTGYWIGDVFVGADGEVWASTVDTTKPNDLFVSDNDGQSFTALGLAGLEPGAWWKTVRTPKTAPKRAYVSGYRIQPGAGLDGGDLPIPLVYRWDGDLPTPLWTKMSFSFQGESQLYLQGVSPVNADVVFLRVDGQLGDTLLRSEDGAMSWTPVLSLPGDGNDLLGFAISSDGQKVLAGTLTNGVFTSTDGGKTFTMQANKIKMWCGGRRDADDALFSCGANWNPDQKAFARSTDDGASWQKVFRFAELDDQLLCAPTSKHAQMCDWQSIKDMFGIGVADAGPPDGMAGAPDAGQPPKKGGNCGCDVGLAAVLFLLPWPRRRRRRRVSRDAAV
jgi:hypothetical protein